MPERMICDVLYNAKLSAGLLDFQQQQVLAL